MKSQKGPTRAQLLKRIAHLQAELEQFSQGMETEQNLRQEGEHWYELVDQFDANRIARLPLPDRYFFMGQLRDVPVVEIPKGAPVEDIQRLHQSIREATGLQTVLYVMEGIRFLKLAPVPEEMEARLDRSEVHNAQDGEGAIASPGSESEGDRLGDNQLELGAGGGSGGDSDQAPECPGQEATDLE